MLLKVLNTLFCFALLSSTLFGQSQDDSRQGRRLLFPRQGILRGAPEPAAAPQVDPRSTQAPSPARIFGRSQTAADNRNQAPAGANQTEGTSHARTLPSTRTLAPAPPNPVIPAGATTAGSVSNSPTIPADGFTSAPPVQGTVMQAGAYSAPPQPSQSTGGEKYFDEALNAFRQNRFSDAITALNVGGYRYPSDPAIQELRSLVLFAKKDFQKASEALRPVLATSDGWDWSIFVEIYGPSNISNYAAQLRELESAVTETPSDASLRFLLAYHYRAAGHMQEAERQMKQAVFLHPRDELARAMLGMPPVIEPPRQEQPILESPTNAKSIPTPPVEELPLKSLQPQS